MLSNDSKDSIHLFLVDLQDNAIESMKEAWVDFTAGWTSGAMAVLTCQPIDTVLTRYQAGIMAQGVTVEQTRGLVNAFGLQSLWRGSSAMISAVPLQNALLMGGYGMGKQWSEKNKQESEALYGGYPRDFQGYPKRYFKRSLPKSEKLIFNEK